MSLSSWLKDYIYIPLGGNRKGVVRSFGFIFITMLIGGLWHGADWKFVLWGALHGAALILHKLWTRYAPAMILQLTPKFISILLTFLFVTFCWIFFRASSYAEAMLQVERIAFDFHIREFGAFFNGRIALLGMMLLAFAYVYIVDARIEKTVRHLQAMPMALLSLLFLLVLQLALQVRQQDVQPFIYFQF